MKLHNTPLTGLFVVETMPIQDERGQFTRIFCDAALNAPKPNLHWAQINISRTYRKGAVRGMHFQYPPAAEVKLIRCIRGRVFDVAVDIRANSPTFMQWHGVELDESNHMQYFIPEGFAHGFQALTDEVQLLYMHSTAWDHQKEGGLRHDDPLIKISWPYPVTQISEKDRSYPLLNDVAFAGIHV
jgi:dTDP-4-dehydrorhamnose 3,5-epimerase